MKQIEIVQKFYDAFQKGDALGMSSCYHPEVKFSDPAFGLLEGERAKSMWKMLIHRSKGNLKIQYSIQENNHRVECQWIATYPYGKSKRQVINRVHANFEFKDGLIVHHQDSFDLWRWSRQAIGSSGLILGWSNFFRRKLQTKTNQMLDKYMSNSEQAKH